jgi:hypothetical protein
MARTAGTKTYADIIPAMQQALARGGLRLTCANEAAAIRTVQRMNQYRILDRKIQNAIRTAKPLPEKQGPNDFKTEFIRERMEWYRDRLMHLYSQYDELIIKRRENVVLLEIKPKQPFIAAETLDGESITIGEYKPPPENPFEDEEMKKSLDLDVVGDEE